MLSRLQGAAAAVAGDAPKTKRAKRLGSRAEKKEREKKRSRGAMTTQEAAAPNSGFVSQLSASVSRSVVMS